MADIKPTHSKGKDDWETPYWLLKLIELEFGPIDLDPCATPESAKAPVFFTEKEDGLSQPWFGNTFVNPPYSQMIKWAEKSYWEAKMGHTENVLFLCAARTDTKAWWDYLRHGEVRFIQGRIRFVDNARGLHAGAPFPSALVVFSHKLHLAPSTVYWEIPARLRNAKKIR